MASIRFESARADQATGSVAPQLVRMDTLFDPVVGTVPSGFLTTNAWTTTAPTYTNLSSDLWNAANKFNTQGQNWTFASGSNAALGCRNVATPRLVGGNTVNHVTEFEFTFTGLKFDVHCIGAGAQDMQIYIEIAGEMYRASDLPLSSTTAGGTACYRNMVFAAHYTGRIRVVMGGCTFVAIRHEANAICTPSPDRYTFITDGDSYMEPLHAFNTGSTPDLSYYVGGISDYIFEYTGFCPIRRGQGSTGYFQYGTGVAITDDDAVNSGGNSQSRFFSNSRKNHMVTTCQDFSVANRKNLVGYIINGTINDGNLSGGRAAMKTRAKACYAWVRSQDPLCPMVVVGPEPYNNAFDNADHQANRLGQIDAITELISEGGRYFYFIDPHGVGTLPWYSGTGSNGSPATSTQAKLTGGDGIHGNNIGYKYYAKRIVADWGKTWVSIDRAMRVA